MRAHTLLLTVALLATASPARAIPAFARRENMSCNSCHSIVPRLNRFGYAYRNAGYRVPSDIGQNREVAIADMISARAQSQATWTQTSKTNTPTATTKQLQFVEGTLYPLSGSFGKYWSSFAEFSFASEDFWEVENAYLRATFGKEEQHFQFRVGVFHPFEGYGASDRPATISRPLFQTTAAKNAGTSTFFTPWGFDQVGVEAGYTYEGFNATATMFNGIYVSPAEQKAFPFQGGELTRDPADPNYDAKDFQLFANQFIPLGKNDAAVSAFYYHGKLSVPYDFTTGNAYTDGLDRFALYGTLPLAFSPQTALWLMGGAQWGTDDAVNKTTGALNGTFKSSGAFGEAFLPFNKYVGGAARYDYFRPSTEQSNNSIDAFTLGLNASALDGVQGILEYQWKDQKTGVGTKTTTSKLQARVILIL